jgi:hypothetical protein
MTYLLSENTPSLQISYSRFETCAESIPVMGRQPGNGITAVAPFPSISTSVDVTSFLRGCLHTDDSEVHLGSLKDQENLQIWKQASCQVFIMREEKK